MKLIYRKLEEIHPYKNNPRKNDDAVDAVAASIKEFGFKVPIIVDKDGEIIAGHTRYKAARKLKLKEVPTITADDLTEEQVTAFRLADNKTGELANWDYAKLLEELSDLSDVLDMEVFEFVLNEQQEENTSTAAGIIESNLDEGKELDLSEFEDEAFNTECPYCGFRWNA